MQRTPNHRWTASVSSSSASAVSVSLSSKVVCIGFEYESSASSSRYSPSDVLPFLESVQCPTTTRSVQVKGNGLRTCFSCKCHNIQGFLAAVLPVTRTTHGQISTSCHQAEGPLQTPADGFSSLSKMPGISSKTSWSPNESALQLPYSIFIGSFPIGSHEQIVKYPDFIIIFPLPFSILIEYIHQMCVSDYNRSLKFLCQDYTI
ncbi:hypothetical protein EDD85DRAFT_584926 [Armillaria nabsnona]|nr:hypothetical protein EDD85DRAFT_584926 [Armillaria nabsnona]